MNNSGLIIYKFKLIFYLPVLLFNVKIQLKLDGRH